jgi:GTP-binding protein
LKVLEAEFLTSAARAADVPPHATPQLALVGRSNVGKSSLINALTKRRVARTSGEPGKTRLVNLYRVVVAGWPAEARKPAAEGHAEARRAKAGTIYLADLPGYGYAKGGDAARLDFAELTEEYFGTVRLKADTTGDIGTVRLKPDTTGAIGTVRLKPDTTGAIGTVRLKPDTTGDIGSVRLQPDRPTAVLLVVDARHPGLRTDLDAWTWIATLGRPAALVATKCDKLGRAELTRALGQIERECQSAVVAVSAETGAGMDDLWKRIATLMTPSA